MRGVCLLLLFAYSISAFAQGEKFKKERRIYLWDVTVSMVGMTSHKEDSRWVDRKDKRTSPKYDYHSFEYAKINVKPTTTARRNRRYAYDLPRTPLLYRIYDKKALHKIPLVNNPLFQNVHKK